MGTNITFLPRNCTIYITVMHAHRGEISLTKIRTPSFDGILAVVGANPNPDLQIRYSIQIFVKLYLDLREKLIEVYTDISIQKHKKNISLWTRVFKAYGLWIQATSPHKYPIMVQSKKVKGGDLGSDP